MYAQDLLEDEADLRRLRTSLRGKGIKGAVGTRASYDHLLAGTSVSPADLEARVMNGLGGTIYRFAFDLRLLQSPALGEWSEPFGEKQVGSSAMPFKRNPVSAENLDSLGRYLAALPRVAWDNAAHSLLERTLDDSANRRSIIPEAFLIADEMLRVTTRIVQGLQIDERRVALNMARYGVFAATERVLMELARAGADRQIMHERIRDHSMAAWESVRMGEENPLVGLLAADPELVKYLPSDRIRALMDALQYIGDAPQRARTIADKIHNSRSSV